MNDDPHDLEPLLAHALAGDQQALADLLGKLRDWTHSNGQGQSPRLDRSDIAQEVCLRAFAAFCQFRGKTVPELLAFVEQIRQNIAADLHRHNAAQKRDVAREVAVSGVFDGLAAGDTTPSQRAEHKEQEARLEAAVQRLPENQRLVFRLRLREQLPFKEVAHRVGVTEQHARVLMLRAVEKLRQELGDADEQQ